MSSPNDFPATLTPSPLAPGLHTARLGNGMRVILREDHRSPVAICNVWVRVGSNREPEKLRGWSHGIEHMLFKGTGRRGEGDFAREVAEAGGSTNAGTGYETTNYHITVPAAELPVAIDILSDVLFHSRFEPEALDAERQVLVHENHMYDDIPFGYGVTWRWGMELAFDSSPYRHPIGGRDENLLERDREDILAFWRSAYRPDNMTVVIVGDVDPLATFARLEASFGSVEAGPPADDPEVTIVPSPPVETDHDGCRLRVEHGDIQKAYAKLVFPGPGEPDGLRAALSVTRRILADGRSCRLYRRLLEDLQLVDEFSVATEAGPREGLVLVDLETDPQRVREAIGAVTAILGELAEDGPTPAELERARVRALRTHAFGSETVQGQAGTIGYHDALGILPHAFDQPERIAAVTAEDVRRCCRRIFRARNLACVVYLPQEADPAGLGIPTDAAQLATLCDSRLGAPDGNAAAADGSSGFEAPAARVSPAAPAGAAAARFTTHQLPGGIPVAIRVDPSVPVLALSVTARGGARYETAAEAGLSALTQMVQVKAAGGMDAGTLHSRLEGEGASIGPRTDRDGNGIFLSGLSGRIEPALELLGEVIGRPAFDDGDIERERRLALQELASHRDNAFQSATLELRELIYGDHPCGRPLAGTPGSLPGLTRADLLRRYAQAWQPENLQIVVSGDCDPDDLLPRLQEMLSGLPPAADPAGAEADVPLLIPRPDGVVARRIRRDQNQSVVLAAWPGPRTPDEDRVALMLLKEILNGQSGRLFEQLRNRRSLCYNTGSIHTAGFAQGMFLGYVMTAPETERAALEALVATLRGAAEDPAGGEEFERARAKLLGNLMISNQSNSSRVARTDRGMLLGRDANDLEWLVRRIGACRPDEVAAVADRMIDPRGRFEVVLGPNADA